MPRDKAEVLYTAVCLDGLLAPAHVRAEARVPGTITVRSQVLIELWYDVARSLIHHGFDRSCSSTTTARTRKSSTRCCAGSDMTPARS